MKYLTIEQIMVIANCSKSTAIEIKYHNLLSAYKLYTDRGNNATATINWLKKYFYADFTPGNDAPRGGKRGNYVTFVAHKGLQHVTANLEQADLHEGLQLEQEKKRKEMYVNAMIISDDEKSKFLSSVQGLSNKQRRKIAYNFAAKHVGFYSTDAMRKFYDLV